MIQLNIAIQGQDRSTKIKALPIQYFIGKQYKHQYMFVGGKGQSNDQSISNTHALSVGRYQMLVELEFPNDDLVDKELKFKVAMQSTESYFMLGCKYPEALSIEDPRAQSFYKQMYNSIAMQKEKRQYFGILGQKMQDPKPATIGYAANLGAQKGSNAQKQNTNDGAQLEDASKGGADYENEAAGQIFMVQHYSNEFKAFV